MTHKALIEPHGGFLVDLRVNEERCVHLKKKAMELPDIILNDRQLCDFELISTGAFSPLTGFMTRADFEPVLEKMRLQDGTLWPIPICLDISKTLAERLTVGQSVAIRDPEGFLLGLMNVEDIWPVSPEREAMAVYNTLDRKHPGANYLLNSAGGYYVGGALEVVSLPLHFDFRQIRLDPGEVRNLFARLGWHRVVGFQTRNPIHRPQFEMTLAAMRRARANLLVLPFTGMAGPNQFDHYTRVRCYRAMARYYPPDSFLLNLLPLGIRMAGPRNALLHAIIAKNFGCTHFIVGRDHASPGFDSRGKPFYGSNETRALAEKSSMEIGVEILLFEEMTYLPFEDEYRFSDQIPKGKETISLSGSDIRERVRKGRTIPVWATFPEVVKELVHSWPPPRKQGFTVFFTGLSGAGKSTIAKVLYSRFLEIGDRPVTLLDGDIVRMNLSSELNFSKEHRDINVRRIGFVASEITKNRGIAVCAPIAPYTTTRSEIRSVIESYGGFVEVHVSTPIEVCEKRDRKGMYAKARAGLIKGFTGVDDPYEVPVSAEVDIDTTALSPGEAAQELLLYLGQKGYI
jgi:sulfate adenylyltransferase